jgi:hypothetical protein
MSTFGEMTTNVFQRLKESQTTGASVTWTEAQIHPAINEGYLDFCEQTKMVEREAELSCTAKLSLMDMRYAFAYPFLGVRRMYSRALNIPLMPSSIKARDDRDNRWEMSSGQVQRFFTRGLYTLGLWPVPVTGETWRASVTSLPDLLVNDTDVPEVPEEFHEAFEIYACYDLKALESEADLSVGFWQEYLEFVERGKAYARDQIKTSRTFIQGEPQPQQAIRWYAR